LANSLLPQGSLHSPQEYVPSEYLSFVPKPLAPVEIPFPDAVTGDIRVQVQLSLFIDETGQVNRVQVDNAQAQSTLQDAAVNTFLSTRFKAGELNGQVVRSLLRVEVIFESRSGDNAGVLRKSTIAM
jgi:outer membrane biosynthesis protein TonB